MNIGPTARGEFDYRAVNALETYSDWMQYNSRSIYSCKEAPNGLIPPEDCRYTYNPKTNRLYLHFFAWPFKAIHLADMAGKVKYAQLLNDASEIIMREGVSDVHAGLNETSPDGALTLELPIIKPKVTVPVIELFLK
jgi:alpha-L-fucosidase